MMSRIPCSRVFLVAAALCLFATASLATTYEIHMTNGNVLKTRYRPVDAPFDADMVQFLTGVGNWMVLPKASIEKIVAEVEAAGYGIQIDDVTLMVGLSPNDKPSPEEEEEMRLEAAADALLNPRAIDYSMPTVSEPNTGGGIPIGFINQTTPPLGGAVYGSGDAAARRGGGGGVFGEPIANDN